jgi:transmembrane sensor
MLTVSELISQILLKKLREEELSPQETNTLSEWQNRSPEHAAFITRLMDEATLSGKVKDLLDLDEQAPWQRIEQALEESSKDQTVPLKRKNSWYKYAAIASLVLVLGIAVYYIVGEMFNTTKPATIAGNSPGRNRAVLTLSNGSVIELDKQSKGILVDEEGIRIIKMEENKIKYEFKSAPLNPTTTHILSTPIGSHYQVELPDGTKVWLNAASSIKFPVSFNALPERKVEMTGEAYFEVSKDPQKQFVALINTAQGISRAEVQVLGTHFNIMAYDEEKIVSTTLIEGRVNMVVGKYSKSLLPGQRATMDEKGELTLHLQDSARLESITSWKNEFFHFEEDSVNRVFREISRWYNIRIVNEETLPKTTFTGTISRSKNLSQTLQVLEDANFHFKMEGDSLTILP